MNDLQSFLRAASKGNNALLVQAADKIEELEVVVDRMTMSNAFLRGRIQDAEREISTLRDRLTESEDEVEVLLDRLNTTESALVDTYDELDEQADDLHDAQMCAAIRLVKIHRLEAELDECRAKGGAA